MEKRVVRPARAGLLAGFTFLMGLAGRFDELAVAHAASAPQESKAEAQVSTLTATSTALAASETATDDGSASQTETAEALASQTDTPTAAVSQTETAALPPAQSPTLSATLAPSPSETPIGPGLPTASLTSSTPSPSAGPATLPFPTSTPSATAAEPATATAVPSPSTTATLSATPTSSETLAPLPTLTPYPALAVLINEVAWAGSGASPNDEWIELHNPGSSSIDLAGWHLRDGGDINVALAGSIPAYSFFLLERTDDTTVADLAADQIYTGSLRNSGERLELLDPSGRLIDSANNDGGSWPAGDSKLRASMERWGGEDDPGNWATYTGFGGNGLDAKGGLIKGTPKRPNSLFLPTPTATALPSRLVINEVLIRPHYDWQGTGGVTTGDEFIEIYNTGRLPVYLKGWFLDDASGTGSRPYELPGVTISGKGYAVFFRTQTKIALNDSGDHVRLLTPDGALVDQLSYLPVRAYNLSFGRFPDGSDNLRYGLWPTPRKANLPYQEPLPEPPMGPFFAWICPGGAWPAGGGVVRASMQRRAPADDPAAWVSFVGPWTAGRDASGNRISGSPSSHNLHADSSQASGWPALVINEIAWGGTRAARSDEWIELHNTTGEAIELSGWLLTDGNDLHVLLSGSIRAGGYFLLERDDDEVVSDQVAGLIYGGSLRDEGETLRLFDATGTLVDSANAVRAGFPLPAPGRVARSPSLVAWLSEFDLVRCGA